MKVVIKNYKIIMITQEVPDLYSLDQGYEIVPVPDTFYCPHAYYNDIRMWDNDFKPRAAISLIQEGFIKLKPEEYISEADGVIRTLTDEERAVSGFISLPSYIEKLRGEIKGQISNSFKRELISGHFLSTVLGIEVDLRRNGEKNDFENVQIIIEDMLVSEIQEITFTGYSEKAFNTTVPMLLELKKEMAKVSAAIYRKKISLDEQISVATTIEELKVLKW